MEYLDRKILADVFQAGVLTLTGGAARPACSAVEDEVVALFDEYREPLLRYLTTFGVCAADAEELLQDVFLALFLHLRGGKSRANLRGWLFRVAHRIPRISFCTGSCKNVSRRPTGRFPSATAAASGCAPKG